MANATIEMPAAASTAMANGDIAPLPPLPIAGTRIAAAIAIAMIGTAFVNGLKMLVVPLVVFSLLCGVLGIGDIRMLGRVGGKSFALYIATTAIAIARICSSATVTALYWSTRIATITPICSSAAHTMAPAMPCRPAAHTMGRKSR